MLDILYAILPVFLILVLGHLLRRNHIPSEEYWNYADKLVYWVLFPALLFYTTSSMDLPGDFPVRYALVLLGGFGAATLTALLGARLLTLAAPAASSVLQGAARHNTFVAIAVATRLYGDEGLALAALATSVLVPVTNVVVVTAMVAMLQPGGMGTATLLPTIVRELARNPLIIAIALGFGVNATAAGEIPVLHDTVEILGRAALPTVLLCIGASLRVQAMQTSMGPFLLSAGAKLVVSPLAIVGLGWWLGLAGAALQVAVIYGAVATASSGYALARQLGGDAPLMAALITLQTLLSLLTMPLTLWLSERLG